ncbi:MAG: sugar porter family MFS transporter [Parachlamydiales bacterium]|nr:sugar porter family MFS transporter [Parachlamydiales bacterium]
MEQKKQKFTAFTLFVAIIAALGGLLFGYNTSVISGAILFLTKDFNLTVFQQEMVVSIILIGALVGAYVGGLFADRLGRKFTLFFTTVLFLIGTIIIMTSHSIFILFIGRIIVGLAIGIVSMAAPLYIAEMSDPKHRGALVSLNQLAITIGILLAYAVDYYFADVNEWRSMFAFGLLPAFLMFIGLFFIPETPTFLISRGKKERALIISKKILLNKSEKIVITIPKDKKVSSWKNIFEKSVRPALYAGIGISIFQQITGINIVIYYAPKIFQMAGFETATTAILATAGVGIINVLMTVVALWLIDVLGRKPLLKIGLIGMVASLFILGLAFMFATKILHIISVISLMSYVAFFAISLGPVAWLIISEIYPSAIRGRAMGIATFFNWASNYIISLTFLTLVASLGTSVVFWMYAAIGLLGLWFVVKKIPETKGKTLEEIQKYWKKSTAKR